MASHITIINESLAQWCNAHPTLIEAALHIGMQHFVALEHRAPTDISEALREQTATLTRALDLSDVLREQTTTITRAIDTKTNISDALREQTSTITHAIDTRQESALSLPLLEQLRVATDQQRLIDTLLSERGTNNNRGVIGELHLTELAKVQWPRAHIIDMSGNPSCSDIHIDDDGRLLVIESKNKSLVTPADVRKADSDIGALSERHANFRCYIFVSLRSAAIPGKGPLCFERRAVGDARHIYVVWCGATGFDDPIVRLALVAADALSRLVDAAPDTTPDIAGDLLDKLRPQLARIQQQRELLDELALSIRGSLKIGLKIATLLDDAIRDFKDQIIPVIAAAEAVAANLTCARCGKKYVREASYKAHVATCKA